MKSTTLIAAYILLGVSSSQRLEPEEAMTHRRHQDQSPALPSFLSPRIIFRKLHPDPEHCYQVKLKELFEEMTGKNP